MERFGSVMNFAETPIINGVEANGQTVYEGAGTEFFEEEQSEGREKH